MKNNFFRESERFTIIAHRGVPREYPENTVESFRRAVDIFPEAVLEMDVWPTADGHTVVAHDEYLESKTDGCGPVWNMNLTDVKKLESGHAISFDGGRTYPFRGMGCRIALLMEVLQAFPESRMSVDIKYDNIVFADRVVKEIKGTDAHRRVIIGSFHDRIVKWVRAVHPDMITSFTKNEIIFFSFLQKLGMAHLFKARGRALIVPEYSDGEKPEDLGPGVFQGLRLVTPSFIRDAHRAGVPVYVWTVNRRENMERLISWGVDGIVSDTPDVLRDVYFR